MIGGGWAGMAAAVTLAERGTPVTVFEAARVLGGRARRVPVNGLALDNGLHILMGCYRECRRLMRLVSPDPEEKGLLRLPLQFIFPRRFSLQAWKLPAPWHLVAGLLRARGVPPSERLAAARFMLALKSSGYRLPQDTSVSRLLAEQRQGPVVSQHLWQPVCVSALNTPPEEASAQVFVNVLRDALAGSREDSDLLLPRTDLSALFPERAAKYVEQRGGAVRIASPVNDLRRTPRGYAVTAGGQREEFSHVVCAVSPHLMPRLTADIPELAPAAALVLRLGHKPIHSVFLQYPAPVRLPQPMTGFAGGVSQWVFDRERLCGQTGLLGVVISAGGGHEGLPQAELAARVHRELKDAFPSLPEPQWHQIIAEKRATFACTPGLERPGCATPLPDFFIAGDYTDSDYPATLEAAVRSGVQCARLILNGE